MEFEKKLVERAKTDPFAFGELFEKYYSPILNYIFHRTMNRDLAEELTSNTFFKALSKISSFKWMNVPFSAWLYRIAANEINIHFRKNKNRKTIDINDSALLVIDKNNSPDISIKENEEKILKNKLLIELNKSIAKLKSKYQEVIVLKYFEKKSIAEISQITGKAEGTIKSLLFRGIEKIKKEINPSLYEEVINGQ